MKISSRYISLLSLAILLSGCSTPSISKPKFENFGVPTTQEVFETHIKSTIKNIRPYFWDEDDYCLQSFYDYKIKYIQSSHQKNISLTNKTSDYYSQITQKAQIDNDNLRFKATVDCKTMVSGNTDQTTNENKYSKLKCEYYCDVVNDEIYCADMVAKIVTNERLSSIKSFSHYAFRCSDYTYLLENAIYRFLNPSYYIDYYYYNDSYQYYINKQVYTITRKSIFEQTSLETVWQLKYSNNKLSLKYKAISTSSNSERNVISSESYSDFSIERTKLSIKKLNYSYYTIKKPNYY